MDRVISCARYQDVSDFKVLKKHSIQPTPDGFILWSIVNFTQDQDKFKTILAFTQAFDAWQAAMDMVAPAGRLIQFKSTNDREKAQIKIYFITPGQVEQTVTLEDGSQLSFKHKWPFDGNGGNLAHVPLDSTDIFFDEGENWGEMFRWEGDTFFAPLMPVAIHEIGHTLDLDHTQVQADIMYPTTDGKVRVITEDTIKGLTAAGWGKKKQKFIEGPSAAEVVKPAPSGKDMILKALEFIGIKEVPGPGNQAEIIAWIKGMFPNAVNDGDTPWCSIFMNFVAKECGIQGTGSGMARSWLKWGVPVKWEDRRPGDVVVFWRGKPDSASGHVALYVNDKDLEGKYVRVLGGNQTDSVSIALYQRERIIEIRRNG